VNDMTKPSIFTQIRLGEIPGEVLFQDEHVFVVMTIAPHNPGHCLVIPIQEIADFEVLPTEIYSRLMSVAQQIAQVQKQVYNSPKIALAAVGMSIDHVHIHVFPLYDETDINTGRAQVVELDKISPEADKIRTILMEAPIV